nr:PREDICTED: uncharacterized protein LOC107075455 [Lepisosteus oculatus]
MPVNYIDIVRTPSPSGTVSGSVWIDSNVLFFQSLSVLVGAAVPKARPVLESQLEQLLTMVHAQVCASFKCPGKPEEERSASLVLRFCVLVCVKETLKEYVLMSFVASLHNPSNQVKYLESQVLIEMGQKGYLGLGCRVLALEYTVKNCALADDTTQAEQSVSSSTVRQSFEAVLACWCADESVTEMLWPVYLLRFLTWRSYSNALPTLCQNLSVLHRRLRENSPSFLCDFDELAWSIPAAQRWD